VVDLSVQGQGELVLGDGAAFTGPWIGGDLAGGDAGAPGQAHDAGRPSLGGVGNDGDLGVVHPVKPGQAAQQRRQRHGQLDPGQVLAHAPVDAVAEGEVASRVAVDVEGVGAVREGAVAVGDQDPRRGRIAASIRRTDANRPVREMPTATLAASCARSGVDRSPGDEDDAVVVVTSRGLSWACAVLALGARVRRRAQTMPPR
jgi:hypothetical protein